MAQPHILQQFNTCAIAHRFTGIETQLWQHLYWLIHTYGQGVCIPTYHLLEAMGISRSQLFRARKALEAAGCLRVEKTNAQRLHYTVMMDGVPVDMDGGTTNNGTTRDAGTSSPTKRKTNNGNRKTHGTGKTKMNELKKSTKSQPTGVAPQPDIVMNGDMEHEIDTFTAQHGYSRMAQRKLLEWYRMRKINGWTMTLPGFVSTMDALQMYCGGDEDVLIKIVDRTLHHRWKGFHPYKIDASSGGINKCDNSKQHKQPGRIPKYDTKIEDLDFLEW